jgi:proteasome lid subunit RPN8/RPN11
VTQKSKTTDRQPSLLIDSEVARKIRQHAHSSTKAEIRGVLIGQDRDGVVKVEASITGLNAEEAGAHVTFTQDTWEHIYKIKDKDFPNDRIVGWYHSHPGFGVFLSEHDTFIHKNFFSSPGQVAWVVDPHSDEEGCFGWVSGRIERLTQIAVVDSRGGERADETRRPEPTFSATDDDNYDDDSYKRQSNDHNLESHTKNPSFDEDSDSLSLQRLVGTIFSYITAILVGALVTWYIFPRVELVPVLIDPHTGQAIIGVPGDPRFEDLRSSDPRNADPQSVQGPAKSDPRQNPPGQQTTTPQPSQPSQDGNGAKGDHAQPK